MTCPDCGGKGRRTYYSAGGPTGLHGYSPPSSHTGECSTCRGTGAVIKHVDYTPASKEERKCYSCSGTGKVTKSVVTERYPSGKTAKTKQVQERCERCGGRGKVVEKQEAKREERYEPDFNARKGGLCFITTACANVLAEPEAATALKVIREFRDSFIVQQSYGQTLLQTYYTVAPEVLDGLLAESNGDQMHRVFQTLVRPCVDLITSNRPDDAVLHYARGFSDLVAQYAPSSRELASRALASITPVAFADGSQAGGDVAHNWEDDNCCNVYLRDEELRGLVSELTNCDSTRFAFGHGADDVFFRLATALRGAGVTDWIVGWPSYEPHLRLVAAAGGDARTLETGTTVTGTRRAFGTVCGHHGAILVVNPGNPTGVTLSRDDILSLRRRNPQATIVVDQSFGWFVDESRGADAPRGVLVVESTSKGMGMPGARLGWVRGLNRRLLSKWNDYFPPHYSTPQQVSSLRWMLRHRAEWRDCLREATHRAREIEAYLREFGIEVSESSTNLVYFHVPKPVAARLQASAWRHGVRMTFSWESAELRRYYAKLHRSGKVGVRIYVVPNTLPQSVAAVLRSVTEIGSSS